MPHCDPVLVAFSVEWCEGRSGPPAGGLRDGVLGRHDAQRGLMLAVGVEVLRNEHSRESDGSVAYKQCDGHEKPSA